MRNYGKLLPFLKPHLGVLILAWGCMLASPLLEGISLWMLVPLLDVVVLNGALKLPAWVPGTLTSWAAGFQNLPPPTRLHLFAGTVLILFLLKNLVSFGQSFFMNDVALRFLRDIRLELYRKYQKLSLNFYSTERTGELVSRITYDVSVIQNAITEGLTDLVHQTARVLVLTGMAFAIHWRLALVALALLPATGYPIFRIGKALRKLGLIVQERMADLTSHLIETFQGIRIIKAFNAEETQSARFAQTNQEYYKASTKTVKRREALGGVTELIAVTGGVVALELGGRAVLSGQLSFGTMAAFLAALLSLHQPFKRLSRLHSVHQQALTAAKRVVEVLEEEPSVREAAPAVILPKFRRQIRFEGVRFQYPGTNRWVLQGVDLSVAAGEAIAIVGASGSGKTTLVNLIPRFYDPAEGRVTLDGVDAREASLASVRAQVGLVTQEPFLFNDTVQANIAFGHPAATRKEVIAAAEAANAHSFIQRFPQGYDSKVGDLGSRLSGGERQRIAIARAILKDPPILILDEATSQLDSQSEAYVQEALDRLMRGRTVFVISHRLSTIRNVERIVVLDQGRLAQAGSHEELLKDSLVYRRLYELQVT